jgi:LysM repeat protein
MKNLFLTVLALLLVTQIVSAQATDLMVQTSDKGLYLDHKVAAKESFFSIGRLYNVHPKAIASYNKLDITKGLAIGQLVRIPLTDTNFAQHGNKGTPVYYKVGEKEGLMKVSSLHNNVTLETLRNWNGLADNSVSPGAKLVVGFLVKEMPAVTLAVAKEPRKEPVKVIEEKKAPPEKTTPIVEKKPEVKEEVKGIAIKTEPVLVKQEEKTTVAENGFFKYHFDQQVRIHPVSKEATVTSGIFKTTSGWLDSKYYLLIDGVQPGTIIRVINPSNSKMVFAKVLGEMSGIRQNEGLNIRISSAAASALQVTEQDKFIVKVNY